MTVCRESVTIAAPVDRTFDLLHDYDRRLEWDPFLCAARLLGDDVCAGVGVRSVCVARGWGRPAMETVYVTFNRPRVAAVRMTRGPWLLKQFAASIRHASLGPSLTRVTYAFTLTTRLRCLQSAIEAIFLAETRRRLAALKKHLEAGGV